jgi:hypothetical protein
MPTAEDLVLGPALRRVSGDRATIWVETARPGLVEVRAGSAHGAARTFAAHGHFYGFVVVEGLPPATATPYEVLLDGDRVWPPPDYPYPQSVIRTRAPDAPVRILFGSCRESSPLNTDRFLPDALDAYAVRLARGPGPDSPEWPDVLMLLGDQVYADETSEAMRGYLAKRRSQRRADAPTTQVVDFGEYTQLYVDSWTDPDIRWLMSTVPSLMIFDDHEIIDDWNISASWRSDMAAQSWWSSRIGAGLSSYWVYQHLGNIDPAAVDDDPVLRAVRATGDATHVLDEFGARADREPGCYQWNYALDLGRTRVVVVDNRAGRQLTPGKRDLLAPASWAWLTEQVRGDYDHLVLGSSLPWLMPPAIHDVESASERLCESRKPRVARFGEKLRRGLDLEHWAAFNAAFAKLATLLGGVANRDDAPATIAVLSGDVHHSYVARATLPGAPIYQLTCSPVHNQLPYVMKPAMRFGWSRVAARIGRGIATAVGAPPTPVRWRKLAGPVYQNAIGELVHESRSATVHIDATKPDKALHRMVAMRL